MTTNVRAEFSKYVGEEVTLKREPRKVIDFTHERIKREFAASRDEITSGNYTIKKEDPTVRALEADAAANKLDLRLHLYPFVNDEKDEIKPCNGPCLNVYIEQFRDNKGKRKFRVQGFNLGG